MSDKAIFDQVCRYGKDYLDEALQRPVFPLPEALENLSHFSEDLPAQTGNAATVLTQLQEYGAPATVAITGGRYFGFVNGSAVPAGMAAKILGTFWDQNTAMYVLSPLAARLESVVEGWLRSIFNLPDRVVAGFVSGTSTANLCALAAARYRLLLNQGWNVNEKGLAGSPGIRVVAGREAHSTVTKMISLLGLGLHHVEFVEADEQGRIKPEAIPELDNRTLLILQAGNVNSGSFDNFSAICEKARNAGAWVHIDGAFGLWAAAANAYAHLTKGIEWASSWAADGHKTINTPYDCGIVLCADKEALSGALHMQGGYIVLSDTHRDGMFYTPEMSRRARIIELWATLKYLGRNGLNQLVSGLCERAQQFARELSATDGFTVLNEVVFNQVVVCCASDELTDKVIKAIQEERVCWVGGSVWRNRRVIRISVCSWMTTEADVTASVNSFKSALKTVLNKG